MNRPEPEPFNPYEAWLAIPATSQPPTFYRLLGVSDGESDPTVISSAALRRSEIVRPYQSGPHGDAADRLLSEIATARVVLCDPRRRADYEAERAAVRASRSVRPADSRPCGDLVRGPQPATPRFVRPVVWGGVLLTVLVLVTLSLTNFADRGGGKSQAVQDSNRATEADTAPVVVADSLEVSGLSDPPQPPPAAIVVDDRRNGPAEAQDVASTLAASPEGVSPPVPEPSISTLAMDSAEASGNGGISSEHVKDAIESPPEPLASIPGQTDASAASMPQPLWKSGLVSHETLRHSVPFSVPVGRASRVWFEVTDGADGINCDWADWINPVFRSGSAVTPMATLAWSAASAGGGGRVRVNRNAFGGPLLVAGMMPSQGIGTHARSLIECEVPPGTTHIEGRAGLDDGGTSQGGTTVQFAIYSEDPRTAGHSSQSESASVLDQRITWEVCTSQPTAAVRLVNCRGVVRSSAGIHRIDVESAPAGEPPRVSVESFGYATEQLSLTVDAGVGSPQPLTVDLVPLGTWLQEMPLKSWEAVMPLEWTDDRSIIIHPPQGSRGYAHAAWKIEDHKWFRSVIRRPRSRSFASKSPLTCTVHGDGRLLWAKAGMGNPQHEVECICDVTGVRELELRVRCDGRASWSEIEWCSPHFLQELPAELRDHVVPTLDGPPVDRSPESDVAPDLASDVRAPLVPLIRATSPGQKSAVLISDPSEVDEWRSRDARTAFDAIAMAYRDDEPYSIPLRRSVNVKTGEYRMAASESPSLGTGWRLDHLGPYVPTDRSRRTGRDVLEILRFFRKTDQFTTFGTKDDGEKHLIPLGLEPKGSFIDALPLPPHPGSMFPLPQPWYMEFPESQGGRWQTVRGGDFENPTLNWREEVEGTSQCEIAVSDEKAFRGQASLALTPQKEIAAGQDATFISEPIAVEVGRPYVLSAFFHGSIMGQGQVIVELVDYWTDARVEGFADAEGWHHVAIPFIAWRAEQRLRIRRSVRGGVALPTVTSFIDEVAITPAGEYRAPTPLAQREGK